MRTIKTIGIIGNGRMGQLFTQMLSPFSSLLSVHVFDKNNTNPSGIFTDLNTVCQADLIIPAVPIPALESVIKKIAPLLRPGQTVMHICSVQVHPKSVLLVHLPSTVNIIGSHPMFGPQTLKACNGAFKNLNFVVDPIRCDPTIFKLLQFFLRKLEFNVVLMSAEEHDKKAAKFHFVSHLVANVLTQMDLTRTPIDTKSYEFLFHFLDRIDPDTELMKSMLKYNPYAKKEAENFHTQYTAIQDLLSHTQ
jgi:prephenate dehydrogenase